MSVRPIRLLAAVLAAGVTLGLATPALAATTPTISAPAYGLGYGPIPITGTARAGATVTLIEAAYIFRGDMKAALDYDHGNIPLVTTANSSGHYTFSRTLDSGFVFAVQADGLRSSTIAVALRLAPTLSVSSTGSTLNVDVAANLAQPGLPVHLQSQSAGGSWTTITTGYTDSLGRYSTSLGGQTATIRAYLEETPTAPSGYADAADNVWANWTDAVRTVSGSATVTRIPATTAPAAPGGVSTPPVVTPPVVPPPPVVTPPLPDITFSRLQYDSPGVDNGSTASLNGEYFLITNRTMHTIDLRGWTVKNAAGVTVTFGRGLTIRGQKSLSIHSGRGTNNAPQLYWGRTSYVWNNTRDTATLRSNTGAIIDTCRYTGTRTGYTTC